MGLAEWVEGQSESTAGEVVVVAVAAAAAVAAADVPWQDLPTALAVQWVWYNRTTTVCGGVETTTTRASLLDSLTMTRR